MVGGADRGGADQRGHRDRPAGRLRRDAEVPAASAIANSRKLRELRVQHAGQPYRVLYAFDSKRNAVLLLGGNKTGDGRWYEKHVPKAEKLFAAYLEETGQTGQGRPIQ